MVEWTHVVAERLRRRDRELGSELHDRLARLEPALRRAAILLRDRFGACDVFLYGSFVWGRQGLASDIDLAVTGVEPRRQFEAIAAIGRLFDQPVDLLRIEDAPDSLRERIQSEGIRL